MHRDEGFCRQHHPAAPMEDNPCCLLTTIEDIPSNIMFCNKYPHDYEDIKWYTRAETYSVFREQKNLCKKDIVVQNGAEFNRKALRGQQL